MDELAATGTEGIRILAGMLVPAGQAATPPWSTP